MALSAQLAYIVPYIILKSMLILRV